MAIALAVAVVGAIGIAAFSSPSPRPSPAPASPAVPTGAAVTSPSATVTSPAPTDTPDAAVIIVIRGVADPAAAIGAIMGCKRVVTSPEQVEPVVAGADVDAAVAAAGRDSGWLYVPAGSPTPQRVWLGEDVVTLAQAAGVTVVTVGADRTVWLGGASGSTRWAPSVTPAGRTAWIMTPDDIIGAGACGRSMATVFAAGMRSLTCVAVGMPACLTLASQGWATPTSAASALDVVVAQPTCPSGQRCASAPPVVVALGPGGSGPGDVRWAISVAPVDGVDATRTLVTSAIPAYALDAIARPSLPLPTDRSGGSPPDCTAAIAGDLRGSPWDPRVAWIGSMAITWPAGSTARFAPNLELAAGDGSVLRAGEAVVATGSVVAAGRAFVACSVAAAGSSGSSPAAAP